MSDDQRSLATYEATVATGLEGMAKDEVRQKLKVESIERKGRIVFTTRATVKELVKLKTINNLFVIVYEEFLSEEDIPTDGDSLETLLMRIGAKCCWQTGIEKWVEASEFKTEVDKIMKKDTELREVQPKFRVSSNRYGPKHKFTSPEICSTMGHVVDTKFGWPIKMKGYDLEIMCNFNENQVYVTLTLTPDSLDRRNIVEFGLTTLKATTCYAILRAARIQQGDIVVDPMAGSGAIPVECCAAWSDGEWSAFTIGGELKDIPIGKSLINLNQIKDNKPPWDMLKLDVTYLPFKTNSIDVFVSDLPFGRRHGSKRLNKTLYPALLNEMARAARIETGRTVLLTQDFKSINRASEVNRPYWSQKMCQFVNVGNLACYIYLFHRTKNVYEVTANKSDTENS